MSLGLRGFHEEFLPLVRVLRARNVLPVFAVGNEGPGTSRSPGNYEQALSVGACDPDELVADFSSSQRFLRSGDPLVPDLVVPGVSVISSVPGGGYAEMDGTSMATPHIAGLAALLFEAVPTASADQVEAALLESCQLPSNMVAERANRGVPNGPRALAILTGGTGAAAVGAPPRKAARKRGGRKKG
jgi:subtilisin family serine protease